MNDKKDESLKRKGLNFRPFRLLCHFRHFIF